jgi:hypothetical protein
MPKYANSGGDSAVIAYEIDGESISVEFKGRMVYVYDSVRPGASHVATMKRLAAAGQGLNSYIGKQVKSNFARKYSGSLL